MKDSSTVSSAVIPEIGKTFTDEHGVRCIWVEDESRTKRSIRDRFQADSQRSYRLEPEGPWHPCKPGFVYVVRFANDIFKIGRSGDVDKRRRAFGEHELVMVHYEWANVHERERALQRMVSHAHLYGELFRLGGDDLIDLGYYWPQIWSGREWEAQR